MITKHQQDITQNLTILSEGKNIIVHDKVRNLELMKVGKRYRPYSNEELISITKQHFPNVEFHFAHYEYSYRHYHIYLRLPSYAFNYKSEIYSPGVEIYNPFNHKKTVAIKACFFTQQDDIIFTEYNLVPHFRRSMKHEIKFDTLPREQFVKKMKNLLIKIDQDIGIATMINEFRNMKHKDYGYVYHRINIIKNLITSRSNNDSI